jgi:8-oxo-dGTP diphosphatase
MEEQKTKISVGILVFKGESVLLGKTRNKMGETEYLFPVGHLEFMESFVECAKREIHEECGIDIEEVEFQFISNTDSYKPKHYVHIGLTAKWKKGTPKVLEKGGIQSWEWKSIDSLPENLTKGARVTLNALKEGILMYDMKN